MAVATELRPVRHKTFHYVQTDRIHPPVKRLCLPLAFEESVGLGPGIVADAIVPSDLPASMPESALVCILGSQSPWV